MQLQRMNRASHFAAQPSSSASIQEDSGTNAQVVTFPNSKYLQAELLDINGEANDGDCSICEEPQPPLLSSQMLGEDAEQSHAPIA